MSYSKRFKTSVDHALASRSLAHWANTVCFAACAILLLLSLAFVVAERKSERGGEVASFFETQNRHLVVLRVPVDDEEDEDEEEEDDGNVAAGNFFANWNTTEAKVYGAKRFLLKQEFQIELDRVNSVCGLEPKQIKKLEIAAKGGVKKGLKDWKEKTMSRFGGINGNQPDDDAPEQESVEEETYTNVADIDRQTLQLVNNGFMVSAHVETVANNKLWAKTLSSTLSQQQKKAWKDFIVELRESKREKMADATVESLNVTLGLTLTQKDEFAKLIRPEMMKAKLEMVETIGKYYEHHMYVYYASKAKQPKLKEILTDAQMQRWNLETTTAETYKSWFDPAPQRRADANRWQRQGFGLMALLEAAGSIADQFTDFFNRFLGR